jgi:hypothetical protein
MLNAQAVNLGEIFDKRQHGEIAARVGTKLSTPGDGV